LTAIEIIIVGGGGGCGLNNPSGGGGGGGVLYNSALSVTGLSGSSITIAVTSRRSGYVNGRATLNYP